MFATVFVFLQYILPHHAISRLVGRLANSERRWVAQPFIRVFARRFKVSMAEARQSDLSQYSSFNEFFTRPLRSDVRPLGWAEQLDPKILICPVDGAVSQAGPIKQEQIFQAKGHDYSASALLGRRESGPTEYADGHFTTLYLSPRDYHRIHMPCDGTLRRMTFVPGRLFSVNPATAARVPGLFARNERVVCEFDTPHGPMSLVLVGAMIVASIATVWAGTVAPTTTRRSGVQTWEYGDDAPVLARGDEMGRFLLGSTVVILTTPAAPSWGQDLRAGAQVRLGQTL